VKRFLYSEYGVRSLGGTNGYQVVNAYVTNYPNQFYKVPNDGSAQLYPKQGDVLSYGSSSPGHTAIVKSVTSQSSGSATVQLIEQNASSTGLTYQDFSSWQFQNGIDNSSTDPNTVTGWLTPLGWKTNSPADSTSSQISAMAASSSTNVWAVGHEIPTGANVPVTYNWNGTSWTKIKPTAYGTASPDELLGVAVDSSGNAWAVGDDYSYPNVQTLAYEWNGSSWVHKTSDNPTSTYTNQLNSVSTDNSGDVYAAGVYYPTGTSGQPLIEKWNGTKFAQQTISNPSGCSGGTLYGISVYSATNIWASGNEGCGSSVEYVIYHYNGTSWTSTVGLGGGSYSTTLFGIKAVSSTEAWAAGRKLGAAWSTIMLHYASGSWIEDTSASMSANLTSIDADSPNDVWAVGGSSGGNLLTLHYNGSSWAKVSTPSVSSPKVLNGVTVNSGYAWTGGYTGSSTFSPLVLQSF